MIYERKEKRKKRQLPIEKRNENTTQSWRKRETDGPKICNTLLRGLGER